MEPGDNRLQWKMEKGVGKVDATLGSCRHWSSRQGATGEVGFVKEQRHEVDVLGCLRRHRCHGRSGLLGMPLAAEEAKGAGGGGLSSQS